jgi:hypothetical protein
MEQILEDLQNKDKQIELRKKYYDNLPSERKDAAKKGEFPTTLCYCNRFHNKTPGTIRRHKWCKNHQAYRIKMKNEEKLIQEKNPNVILCDDGEFLYKDQLIKYYYFLPANVFNDM